MKPESNYFPLFVDLTEKKIVVAGGGKIACRRIRTLLQFAEKILLISPEAEPELRQLAAEGRIEWRREPFRRELILDADMVLACTDDPQVNGEIHAVCRALGILVNVCSDRRKCDFYFPGVVKKDHVVIGVTAGGKDHRKAREVREKIRELMDREENDVEKKRKITIGSRESALAVVQSRMVMDYIEKNCPELEAGLLTMKTTGDRILDRRLDQIGGKGLFVKELDKALKDGRSDLSVHSLKDLPMEVPEELPVVCWSKREDPRDVLVLPEGRREPDLSLPIGTSSLRRIIQLKELYPEARFESVRGNLQTRLRKLDEGQYGALVLAAAGMKRMGLEDRISRYFSVEEVIPSAGQGILAVQGREGEDYAFLEGFGDRESALAAAAERAFVRFLDGGCSSPIAAHARIKDGELELLGLYYEESTKTYRKGKKTGPAEEAEKIGVSLARELKEGRPAEGGQKMEKGKVWLVGAGPGDCGLFTLKGLQVLQQADVVVYDSLVGGGVLAMIPQGARTVNVGKRASRHTMPQEQINRLLAEEAEKGLKVVRLKGGDPFLFGRGGEELELLAEKGIPYEVVPGVTSSIAVPAYNGIPVTHRDFTSSLHIITGHKKAGQPYDINFRALVETEGTLVFLMGVTALPDICAGLLQAGMDPDMPAAVLQQGTTAGQKRVVATVGTLEEEVRRQGIETPAIIVVGRVCGLAEEFAWYEKLPLAGWRVLVTRPKELISSMARKLRVQGAEVLELPAIATVPLEENERLRTACGQLETFRWIAFTSPTGVRVFFDKLKEYGLDVRKLAHLKIAAIGEGTRKALLERGLLTDLMPEVYDGGSLGEALASVCEKGDRILLPRAEAGSREILDRLKEFSVEDIPTYRTVCQRQEYLDEKALFEKGGVDCAVFTSASTVRGFAEATPGLDYTKVRAACIGKQTKAAADALGMETYMAEKATIDSLVQLVIELRKSR
jgi:uroporphyrinogen III methyltransferase/synthase